MKIILLETHYLPSIAYFSAALSGDEILLERHENFQKQTYRNRCYINTSQGPIPLIVPLSNAGSKTIITDIQLDYTQRWQNNHWRAIQSGYGKAPYFQYYADDLREILFADFTRLIDLNSALLTLCLKWLKCKIPVRGTSVYEKSHFQPVYDLRSTISPKNSTSVNDIFQPAIYRQVFGNKFVENLSLIDLIFCEGPGALGIVQASTRK